MIVKCLVDSLMDLIGKKLSIKKLEDTLFLLKAEVERIEGNEIEIEINPDRQDMLSAEGIARAVKSFLGIEKGLKKFDVKKSGHDIIVKPGLTKIRPYIACGIVLGITVDDILIKEYMHLQEALTSTHGRNRRKASIGLYVHDDIQYPVRYHTESPSKIKFIPLGTESEMDGIEILNKHEKGIEFGGIISDFKEWPLLSDADGQILSLPPIINSNSLGRVTEHTSNIFVEVTGTHLPTVEQSLNIMCTSLAERGGTIQSVKVKYPDGSVYNTPNLKPIKMKITSKEIEKLTALGLSDDEVVESLEKMGYEAKITSKGKFSIKIPAYRTDILHAVDVIEDIAIGYGFDRIEATMPSTMTAGKLTAATRLKNKTRDLLIGMGYQEVLSYIMSSPDIMNTFMLKNKPLVETGNPKSRDYSVLRNSLIPVLLSFTSQNQHVDYPHLIFEVGDVVKPDKNAETRSQQIPYVSGLYTDVTVNITELMSHIGFLLRNLDLADEFSFEAVSDASFMDGRCADIIVKGKRVGRFGEISPEVLSNFEIEKPVVAFELMLLRDGKW